MWIIFDLIAFFAKSPRVWVPAMLISAVLYWYSLHH